jgi:hypothetical protein
MSFDLIVFSPRSPNDLQARLQSAIQSHDRRFFVRLRGDVTSAAGFDLYFGMRVADQAIDDVSDDDCIELPIRQLENDQEIDEFLSLPDLSEETKSLLRTMRYSGMISTSAGRSLEGYVLQCFAAAAFVEASAGVLCNPQADIPDEYLLFGSAVRAQMQRLANEYAESPSDQAPSGTASRKRSWFLSTRSMTLLSAALGAALATALVFEDGGKLTTALLIILMVWGVGPYFIAALIAMRREPSLALLVATSGMLVCDIGYAVTWLLPLAHDIRGFLAGLSAGKALVIAPIVYAIASYLAARRGWLKSA